MVNVALVGVVSMCFGHGINGHINVTQWSLKESEPIREWRLPDCQNAMVFGSAFPDTGYAVSHAYGELTHWTPFLSAFIESVRDSQTVDVRTKCFVVGLAAHGLQDEIFDTFFLEQVEHFDGAGQDIVDPGLDAIMVVDGVAQAKPDIYVPTDQLIQVLASHFGVEVEPSVIEEGARRVKLAVIDHFGPIAENYAREHRDALAWAEAHYLDPAIVGSLASEVEPTRGYAEAVWARLESPVVARDVVSVFEGHSIGPEVNNGVAVYGLVLSRGVSVSSIRGGIRARPLSGGEVEYFQVAPGRWTQSDDSITRVIRLEASDGRILTDYEFAAADEWIWIDGTRTVGDWFTLTPHSQSEKSKEDTREESGCGVTGQSNLFGALTLVFLVLIRREGWLKA